MSYWNNKKVLVTGAGGFIGSHLVETLVKSNANVRAFIKYNSKNSWGHLDHLDEMVKKNLEVFIGDLQDSFAVRKAVKGVDVVFHLGALIGIPYSYIAPEHYVNTNIKGTLNVLEACLSENTPKLIHTSTSETYGTAQYTPIDESHPLQGQSPYSASKIGADKLAESYHLSFNLPVSTIRPFNTFGPRQSARAVIPTIISQALSGAKKIKLGSSSPVRDFLFVKDTVKGFLAVAQSEDSIGKVINVGYGKGISIGELANKILSLLQKEHIEIITDNQRVRPNSSEVFQLLCNNNQAKQLLNWEPQFTLEEGLKATIDYIQKNMDKYKPEIYNI